MGRYIQYMGRGKKAKAGKKPAKAWASSLRPPQEPQPTELDPTVGQARPQVPDGIVWGSKAQPFYRPGANPTVDLVVVRSQEMGGHEVLLVRRSAEAGTFAGRWALPGGFHDTEAYKGSPWQPGEENSRSAAARELAEETKLELGQLKNSLRYVGYYDAPDRDPRNNPLAWAVTNAYLIYLEQETAQQEIEGQDDVDKAQWVPLAEIGKYQLAFDHEQILKDAVESSWSLASPFNRWQ